MNTMLLGTLSLGALGILGNLTEMPGLAAGSTAAMAALQLWTLAQINPIKDRLAEISTRIAVMEQRCEDAKSRCKSGG